MLCFRMYIPTNGNDILFYSQTWVGLRDTYQNGVYQWVDGTYPLLYQHWQYGSPVNNGQDFCVAKTVDGSWINMNCSLEQPFLCAKTIGKHI